MKSNVVLRISILKFDPLEHRFAPSISMIWSKNGGLGVSPSISATPAKELTLTQAQHLFGTNAVPSSQWIRDYNKWFNWKTTTTTTNNNTTSVHCHGNGGSGSNHGRAAPIFLSTESLDAFNDTGKDLVHRLRAELKSAQDSSIAASVQLVLVDDFLPLYCCVEVGESWWHVRDCAYGCVVPIQHLPVSDALKSRLQVWRLKKSQCMLKSPNDRCQLHAECHDLEEHILWELNVRTVAPLLLPAHRYWDKG